MWTTEGSGRSARALHTGTGAHNMREHRLAKRAAAEARNLLTPPERRRSARA